MSGGTSERIHLRHYTIHTPEKLRCGFPATFDLKVEKQPPVKNRQLFGVTEGNAEIAVMASSSCRTACRIAARFQYEPVLLHAGLPSFENPTVMLSSNPPFSPQFEFTELKSFFNARPSA